jgi:hypothetical protein
VLVARVVDVALDVVDAAFDVVATAEVVGDEEPPHTKGEGPGIRYEERVW